MPLIRVSESSKETLKKLSKKSGLSMCKIIEEWTQGVGKIIDEKADAQRFSYTSSRPKDTNFVVTQISELCITSLKIVEVEENE